MKVKTAVSLTLIFLGLGLISGCQQNNRGPEPTTPAPQPAMPANTISAYPVPTTATPDHAYPGGVRPSPLPVSPTPTIDCIIGNDLNVSLTEQFDPYTALLVLYGEGCIDNENQSIMLEEKGVRWIISPLIAIPYTESGVPKMIFLTQKTQPSWYGFCHPCGAVIGGFLLAWKDDRWQVIFQRDLFSEGLGDWGTAPPAAPIQLGPNKQGVVFRSSYTSTGNSAESIYIIAPWRDEIQVVASLVDTGASEVVNDSWGYTSSLEMVRGSNPDFDDIRVVTSGTKWIIDAIRPFTETRFYVFEEGQYQLEE